MLRVVAQRANCCRSFTNSRITPAGRVSVEWANVVQWVNNAVPRDTGDVDVNAPNYAQNLVLCAHDLVCVGGEGAWGCV